jgi:hypothetical protein
MTNVLLLQHLQRAVDRGAFRGAFRRILLWGGGLAVDAVAAGAFV